jgi:hypothetical protein
VTLEATPSPTKPCGKSGLIGQHVNLQNAFPVGGTPIKASALFQSRFANDVGRNGHLILSRYSRNHGMMLNLDQSIVKESNFSLNRMQPCLAWTTRLM